MSRVPLRLDGKRSFTQIDVRPGSLMLAAIVRARWPIGRSCRGRGVCFACKVEVLEGAARLSPRVAVEDSLPERERLACCARVHGACTVRASYW